MDVRLDSEDGALPDVGTLRADAMSFVAAGAVHRRATTDANGAVVFASLPRARYRLAGLPLVAAPDGITVVPVDLSDPSAPNPSLAVTLAPKVTVRGRLPGAPAGTRILVLDDQPELGRSFPEAPLDATGAYVLALDPNHAYHLLADPPRDQDASRVPLGPLATGAAGVDQGDRAFPHMLPFTGTLRDDTNKVVPGALVQIFCYGPGPDCLDASDLGSKDPLPLSEALADSTGAFASWVPDPAAN
jgi:hypothetical protein